MASCPKALRTEREDGRLAPALRDDGAPSPDRARKDVADLVERFSRDVHVLTSPDYKGTQVRAEFIEAVCDALGRDLRHRDTVVALVERVLDVRRKLAAATTPPRRGSTSARSRPRIERSTRWCTSCMG